MSFVVVGERLVSTVWSMNLAAEICERFYVYHSEFIFIPNKPKAGYTLAPANTLKEKEMCERRFPI